ncbi:MAG: OsmC family protein [Hyphomicrobiaceae bacterium]
MAGSTHRYECRVTWTGNDGTGTSGYRAYRRDHTVAVAGKPEIAGSSDPAFRGDASRHNPEDLLVASISSCHMLWYLHLASDAGIVVTEYVDDAVGTMVEDRARGGWFNGVVLRPAIKIAPGGDVGRAIALHQAAHEKCFIANSLNFPVTVEPRIAVA